MRATVGDTTIETVEGDISQVTVDAIVNAANNELWMGSGVAGALKAAGGREIEDEAISKGPIEVGASVATTAGRLSARWVIHAAAMGPGRPATDASVRNATRSALRLASELGAGSIALPALGAGVGGFPVEQAAEIMVDEAVAHARAAGAGLAVTFVVRGAEAAQAFDRGIERHARGTPPC